MWEFDNAIFNVNGVGKERLSKTLEVAIGEDKKFIGYILDKTKGIILFTYKHEGMTEFPFKMNAYYMGEIIYMWMQENDNELKDVYCGGWDANVEHDGSNKLGWRVYTEDWGKVSGHDSAIAVKPAYVWFGK